MKIRNSNASPVVRILSDAFADWKSRFTLLICFLSASLLAAGAERVRLVRTPDDGLQPQAAVDSQGVIHLIYFKGDDRGGDIFYVRQESGKETFSKPIQVFGPDVRLRW